MSPLPKQEGAEEGFLKTGCSTFLHPVLDRQLQRPFHYLLLPFRLPQRLMPRPPGLVIISRMLAPHEQDEVFAVLDSPVPEIKESCRDKCSAFWKDYCQCPEPFSETNTDKH